MNIDKLHKKDLGLTTPDNYFNESKSAILTNVESETKPISIYKKPLVWTLAASITLLITFTVFNLYTQPNNIELEDDILVSSLFEKDSQIDAFLDKYIEEEIITNKNFIK